MSYDVVNAGPMMEVTFGVMFPLSKTGLKLQKQALLRGKKVSSSTAAYWLERRTVDVRPTVTKEVV